MPRQSQVSHAPGAGSARIRMSRSRSGVSEPRLRIRGKSVVLVRDDLRRLLGLMAGILAAAWPAALPAQVVGVAERVEELAVQPAAAPRPALKYRLLPALSEQTPGVAAPLYAQAFLALQERKVDEATWAKLQGEWPNAALEELPKEELRQALEQLRPVLQVVDEASRRRRYGLELTPDEYARILPALRPQPEAFRTLARILMVRTRLHILDGDCEGAIRSLRSGYAMARHCAEQPTVVHALVGIALAGIMNHSAREVIQMPDAVNLYWALTALPERFVDLGPVFEFDALVFEQMFPEYVHAKAEGATPEHWQTMLDKIVSSPPWSWTARVWQEPTKAADKSSDASKPALDALLAKALPVARRVLRESGISETDVERMSPAEMAARAALEAYQTHRDETAKWCYLPYAQAERPIQEDADKLARLAHEAGMQWDAVSEGGILMQAAARLDRDLAALRCLEAIRLHAASHSGQLPERLEDITEVPVPPNPLTGQPFRYRAEERYVILDIDGGAVAYQWWIRLADR